MPSSVTLPKRADGKEGNVRQYAQPRGNLPEAENDQGRKGPRPHRRGVAFRPNLRRPTSAILGHGEGRSQRSSWRWSSVCAFVPCSRGCGREYSPKFAVIEFPEIRMFRYPAFDYRAHSQEEIQ